MSDQEPYDPENEPGKRNQIAAGEEASSSAPERLATVYGCEEGAVLFPNAKAEAAFVRDGGRDAAGVSVDLGPVHADEFDPGPGTPPQPWLLPQSHKNAIVFLARSGHYRDMLFHGIITRYGQKVRHAWIERGEPPVRHRRRPRAVRGNQRPAAFIARATVAAVEIADRTKISPRVPTKWRQQ